MSAFSWPGGKRAALSLSFDDARITQADVGLPILDEFGAKGTFYVNFEGLEQRLEVWRAAAQHGHELANHTVTHPCSGNFAFARCNPLEEYSVERMERELDDASAKIEELTGVTPRTFAYPCGQKFIGRGEALKSYIPLVAKRFLAGRGFRDESDNDPVFCDLAQLMGIDSDSRTFDSLMEDVEKTLKSGGWLIFCSHNVGEGGYQTFHQDALAAICKFARDENNGVWLDTVENIAQHIKQSRS
jgi:peptidoglycan/xylan/chitin deacetylase (PgdA/CDA1 family)